MLSILQQLPRVKWMITTLGKRGSVLVQKQDTQHQQDNAVLEDQLKTMLRQVASSSHTKSSAGDGAGAGAGAADCISQSKTHIRSECSPQCTVHVYFAAVLVLNSSQSWYACGMMDRNTCAS